MMKKMTFLLLLCLPMVSCTPEGMKILTDVLDAGGGAQALTTEQISMGLKEALTNGISKGADLVSKTDGYYKNPDIKLLFPPQAQKVEQKLRDLGLGNLPDQLIEKLNRAAEDAAKEAKPIFVSAI